MPELLESRDKESVTFGHLNDSRSREFEGEGETQDSGCCSPYTLDLHVIKHPPKLQTCAWIQTLRGPVGNHGAQVLTLHKPPTDAP